MKYITDKTNIIIYDFETDGLIPERGARPISFGCIRLKNDGEIDVNHLLIKRRDGSRPLSENVINYHQIQKDPSIKPITTVDLTGITDELLEKQGLNIEVAFRRIADLFDIKDRIVSGHNIINFDNKFANFRFHKYNHPCSIDVRECFDTGGEFKAKQMGWNKFNNISYSEYHIEALKRRIKGLLWNLNEARTYYKIEEIWDRTQHHALVDVGYTGLVLLEQLKVLNEIDEDYYNHFKQGILNIEIPEENEDLESFLSDEFLNEIKNDE